MCAEVTAEATQPHAQSTRLRWIQRWEAGHNWSPRWMFDAALIIMGRGLRSFACGLLAVVLGV